MPDIGGGLFTAFMAAKDAGKGLGKGKKGGDPEGEEEPEGQDPGGQSEEYQEGYEAGFNDARNGGGGFQQPSGGASGWGDEVPVQEPVEGHQDQDEPEGGGQGGYSPDGATMGEMYQAAQAGRGGAADGTGARGIRGGRQRLACSAARHVPGGSWPAPEFEYLASRDTDPETASRVRDRLRL